MSANVRPDSSQPRKQRAEHAGSGSSLEIPEAWSYPRETPREHIVQQGTEQWRMLRAGVPTASQFHRVITPKKMQLSESRHAYKFHLVGERIQGRYLETFAGPAMRRGSELEAEAIAYYQFATRAEYRPCGFLTILNGKIGASPDGLIGENGSAEIKCSETIATHVAWLLGDDSIAADYRTQVQGQMWVGNREWVDTIAYHPDMPKAIIRAYRDDAFIKILANAVMAFSDEVDECTEKCRALGYMEEAAEIERANAEEIPIPSDPRVWQAFMNGTNQ